MSGEKKSNLVIVESPEKAKTIEKFLGKEYLVTASKGHIRDLSKSGLSIDIEKGFEPKYEISSDKKKLVKELKDMASEADTVWLASDEDREGEAIAWHLSEVLAIPKEKTKRIVFHEITKTAILNAIENPRDIDMNLVMAQQARRVLDRLVGFELSPVLWRRIQPKLSAGRVQSVAVRLIVDREREINAFTPQRYFRTEGIFIPEGGRARIKALADAKFSTEAQTRDLLERCRNTSFSIASVITKEGTRTPAAPFTTSSLQQEAARKLGFSVSQTMTLAQKLYEAGKITYMRTDSTNLSSLAINAAKETIGALYGEQYSKVRNYHTKVKGAQEAHEAIRPTLIANQTIEGTAQEKKLYNLIWKRTIASQMADARIEKTDITIAGDNIREKFSAQGEQILFDGFLKVYIEGKDDVEENETTLLPKLEPEQIMRCSQIVSTEKYTQHTPRYNEASLIKKMEEIGIGRPSTYAPTITTIIKRGYITKGDRPAKERKYIEVSLMDGKLSSVIKVEMAGAEKSRLYPENIGMSVTDYLAKFFSDIIDYSFTANAEENLDKIAAGEAIWNEVIREFYKPFHGEIDRALGNTESTKTERILGTDPSTGKVISARIGRFGPLVQRGANDDPDKQFAKMKQGQLIESITLEEALDLLKLPRKVGYYNGNEITAAIGRFGPYLKYDKSFISLGRTYSPYTVTEEEAINVIEEHNRKEKEKFIADFPSIKAQILNGRFGAYIKQGGNNYKIPRGTDPAALDEAAVSAIIAQGKDKKGK